MVSKKSKKAIFSTLFIIVILSTIFISQNVSSSSYNDTKCLIPIKGKAGCVGLNSIRDIKHKGQFQCFTVDTKAKDCGIFLKIDPDDVNFPEEISLKELNCNVEPDRSGPDCNEYCYNNPGATGCYNCSGSDASNIPYCTGDPKYCTAQTIAGVIWSKTLAGVKNVKGVCDTGYAVPSGSSTPTRDCELVNGVATWGITTGSCQAGVCSISNIASYISSNSLKVNSVNYGIAYGSNLTVPCVSNAAGSMVLSCSNSGSLSHMGACYENGCDLNRLVQVSGSGGLYPSNTSPDIHGSYYNNFVANNVIVDGKCATGYFEVGTGGDYTPSQIPLSSSQMHYVCKNGVWKTVGSCQGVCEKSVLTTMINNQTVKGSKYLNSASDLLTKEKTTTDANKFNHGAIAEATCNTAEGYVDEISESINGSYSINDVVRIFGSNYSKYGTNLHSYICESGQWKTIGGCAKRCSKIKLLDKQFKGRRAGGIKFNDSNVLFYETIDSTTNLILENEYKYNQKFYVSCPAGFKTQTRHEVMCDGATGEWTTLTEDICDMGPQCYEFRTPAKIYEFTAVPDYIDEVEIQIWGAPGGRNSDDNSLSNNTGGYAYGKLNMSNNRKLYVVVGGKGENKTTGAGVGGVGGYNGGGNGTYNTHTGRRPGAGGGGATDIRLGGTALSNRVAVAGGSGGTNTTGSTGGGTSGGVYSSSYTTAGSQSSGGLPVLIYNLTTTGAKNIIMSSNGILGFGGTAGFYSSNNSFYYTYYLGGGGGGYYGGAGGSYAYGTGGSGYVGGLASGTTTSGSTTKSPSDGGFARICWGDWGDETNPCTNNQANFTANTSKRLDGSTDLCTSFTGFYSNQTLPTPPKCSGSSLVNFFKNNSGINIIKSGDESLISDNYEYYQNMKVYSQCVDGFEMVDGVSFNTTTSGTTKDFVEITCTGTDTWTITKGSCVPIGCFEFDAGSGYTMTVPTAITSVDVQLWGAQGGIKTGSENNANSGGYTYGKLNTASTKTFYVTVGTKGIDTGTTIVGAGKSGGFNGGGNGTYNISTSYISYIPGAGGGGATDIRLGGTSISYRKAVAGGGGGSASSTGGAGGATSGGNSSSASTQYGGYGGSQSAGGVKGSVLTSTGYMTAGVLGVGGGGLRYEKDINTIFGSGGGGGGYYGGSSRTYFAGGGGSGYIGGLSSAGTIIGSSSIGKAGDGYARICWGEWETAGKTNPCTGSSGQGDYAANSACTVINSSTTGSMSGVTASRNSTLSSNPLSGISTCTQSSLITALNNANAVNPGSTYLGTQYYNGQVINASCNTGYVYSGSDTTYGKVAFTCSGTNTWTATGSCLAPCLSQTFVTTIESKRCCGWYSNGHGWSTWNTTGEYITTSTVLSGNTFTIASGNIMSSHNRSIKRNSSTITLMCNNGVFTQTSGTAPIYCDYRPVGEEYMACDCSVDTSVCVSGTERYK